MSNLLAIDLRSMKCDRCHENEDQEEKLHDDVETVTKCSYLSYKINSRGGCKMAVTSRTRI